MRSTLAYARFATSFIASALLGRRSLTCLWELTYRCNARCAICAYWRHPSEPQDEMTLADIQEGLDRVFRHGCRFVNFTGGEPTLRRDLEDIVGHASRLGMWTSMVSNGATLTRERVRSLKRAGLDTLMISNSKGIPRFACAGPSPSCHAGQKYFSIDPFGYLHPCVDMPAVGHLLRDPIAVVRGARARGDVEACRGCWYCFRGEADSSLSPAGWLDRLSLGVGVVRRNYVRHQTRQPGDVVAAAAGARPWTPQS